MANLSATTPGIKGGYWLSKQAHLCPPNDIPPYFTHVFYASVGLDRQNYSIIGLDERLAKQFTSALKAKGIKSFLSIGGRPDSEIPNPLPDSFSRMASTPAGRQSFIRSSIAKARDNVFDGLDLDWEYPNTEQDMENLASLLREWRAAINSESPTTRPILSVAVNYKPSIVRNNIAICYCVDEIREYVDLVGLRCYDYYTSRDTTVTAAHARLNNRNGNRDPSTSFGIEEWINARLEPSKLLMGLPLYGRTWTLADPRQNGIGAPAIENVMPYRDMRNSNAVQFGSSNYDDDTVSEYSYSGTFWVGYDGLTSIPNKVRHAKTKRIGGYFLWEIQLDLGWGDPHASWELSKAASDAWDGANNR